MSMTLYGYWRSTAAYRVRIALGLKALPHDAISISLRTGEQSADAYKAINPQGFVPFLVDGNTMLGQSLAIIRSEEHTSELQSLMRISYAVFCLKKKNNK